MSIEIDPPVLTLEDLQSAVWQKLRIYWTDRLNEFRCQNDGDLSPEKTAALRGRIKEISANLDLAERAKTG